MDQDVEAMISVDLTKYSDIKLCPGCSHLPVGTYYDSDDPYYILKCPTCQSTYRPTLCTPAQSTLDSAICSWNNRVDLVRNRIAKHKNKPIRYIPFEEVKHDDFVSFLGGE